MNNSADDGRGRPRSRTVGQSKASKKGIRVSADRMVGSHMFVQGATGSGKSYMTRKLTEIWLSSGKPALVLDIEDEFHSLRELHPEILLIGGDHCDVPLTPHAVASTIRTLLEWRVSLIFQLHEFPRSDRALIVAAAITALMEAPKELHLPVLVVIDEVRHFAPQNRSVASLEPIIDLLSRGRKRQFTALLASQRMASVSNEVLGNADTYFMGKTGIRADQEAALWYLPFRPSEPEARGLTTMDPGHFWATGSIIGKSPVLLKTAKVASRHGKTKLDVLPRRRPIKKSLLKIVQTLSQPAACAGAEHGSAFEQPRPEHAFSTAQELERELELERKKRVAAEEQVAALRAQVDRMMRNGAGSVGPTPPSEPLTRLISEEAAGLLRLLAAYPKAEITKPALAMATKSSPRSQGFVRGIAELVSKGLVRELQSSIRLTEEGRAVPMQSNGTVVFDARFAALHDKLDARCRKALSILASSFPRRVATKDLARLVGLTANSRRLKPLLEKLARRKLIKLHNSYASAADQYVELHNAKYRSAA